MCEGIEIALLMSALRGAELIADTKKLRVPHESVMGLAALKCKQRENGSYTKIQFYQDQAKLELMSEQVFADVLREHFPDATVSHMTDAGTPYDVVLEWPAGPKLFFDVKTVGKDAATITQTIKEHEALATIGEDLIYVVLQYVGPTCLKVLGSFFPIAETWEDSKFDPKSKFTRQAAISSWM